MHLTLHQATCRLLPLLLAMHPSGGRGALECVPQGHDWNYADGILGLGLPGTALPVPPQKSLNGIKVGWHPHIAPGPATSSVRKR